MQYKYIEIADDVKSYKIDGQTLHYLKNYEEAVGGAEISSYLFGDVKSAKKIGDKKSTLDLDNYTLSVFPLKSKLNFFEKIVGYVPCIDAEGTSGWLRIVGKSKAKILSLLLMLLLLAGAAVYFLTNRGPDLDDSAVAYEMPDYMVNKDPEQVLIPGYETITVDKDNIHSETILVNPEGNLCYMQYEIRLTDTQEVIYQSGFLEPGKAIPGFDLDSEVDKGEYDIEVVLNTFDINEYEQPLNGGVIDATLQVE